MTWLTQNWFWILIFIAFMAMHLFGHRGHGGHCGHGGGDRKNSVDDRANNETPTREANASSRGHQH